MKFAIQINSGPYHSQAGETAYQFVLAAQGMGHEILRIFFYYDGIYHALATATPPEDERQLVKRWSQLAEQYSIDLVVCISAAQRRGLLCQDENKRQDRQDNNLAPGFRISGLGQLAEATLKADRFLVFGQS
jgi:tRNA 2-thiouridine synthesizing protein D